MKNTPKTDKGFKFLQPSMSAAAAATTIPLAVFKLAKRAGCDAFCSNGNVKVERLMPFLQKHPELLVEAELAEEIAAIRLERAKAAARLARVQADLAEGLAVPKSEAIRAITRFVMALKFKSLALPKRLAQRLALESDRLLLSNCWKRNSRRCFVALNANTGR